MPYLQRRAAGHSDLTNDEDQYGAPVTVLRALALLTVTTAAVSVAPLGQSAQAAKAGPAAVDCEDDGRSQPRASAAPAAPDGYRRTTSTSRFELDALYTHTTSGPRHNRAVVIISNMGTVATANYCLRRYVGSVPRDVRSRGGSGTTHQVRLAGAQRAFRGDLKGHNGSRVAIYVGRVDQYLFVVKDYVIDDDGNEVTASRDATSLAALSLRLAQATAQHLADG